MVLFVLLMYCLKHELYVTQIADDALLSLQMKSMRPNLQLMRHLYPPIDYYQDFGGRGVY